MRREASVRRLRFTSPNETRFVEGSLRLRLSVIGCGYVGLVTGACLAEAGHEVVCTDIDRERIAKLNAGGVPISEHDLDQVLASAHHAGKISYTADAGGAIQSGAAIVICVGAAPQASGVAHRDA